MQAARVRIVGVVLLATGVFGGGAAMSGWEWFAVIAGGASVASLPVAMVLGWFGRRTAVDFHAAMRSTLADISKGLQENQERLRQIIERLDQRADERHWESLQVLERLRG